MLPIDTPFRDRASTSEEQFMSKGQKRSNREPKKPKRIKPKTPASATSSAVQTKVDALARAKKKW
jgi:hypothetical protein